MCFIPMMAVSVRRLHDTGHSAWWYFWPVIIATIYSCTFLPLLFYGLAHGKEVPINVGMIASFIIALVLIIWSIVLLVFCLKDSDPEENEYGPSPKYQ